MTFTELRAKFDADIRALQESCTHKEVGDWTMYDDGGWPRWIGRDARVCKNCNMVIEDRRPSILFQEFLDQARANSKVTFK